MMRWFAPPLFVLMPLLLTACSGGGNEADVERKQPETPRETAERFLSLWQSKDYEGMYGLLSLEAQATIDRDKFVGRYEAIAEEATITSIDYEVGQPEAATENTFPVTVTIHTAFFGDIQQENAIPLVRDQVALPASPEATAETSDQWRVSWQPSLIFAELDGETLVHFFTKVPRRGGIYDREGKELAVDAQVPVIGIVPDLITDKPALISALAGALGVPESDVRAKVESDVPSYYFVPVKTLPYGTPQAKVQKFFDLSDMGVVVREETLRVYPNGSAAAHVLGYMTEVTPEQLKELAAKGYKPGDLVGAFGLEGQLDKDLAGERGGTLATITPEGTIARTIAEKPDRPGKDLFLTIDIDVQKTAESALGERVGAVVVMSPRDNSVLALASFPRFDPNAFIRGLTGTEFTSLTNDPREPFLHRPLLSTSPPGSTFKVVTAAAGLERGGFTAGSTVHCSPVWTGLGPDFAKNNWQKVDRGYLTPAEGLMASCNPVFYEMGLALDHAGENILPEFARKFGYGQPTGINGLDEAAGIVPDPQWKEENKGEPWFSGDTVNMAIGQGFLAVTPLQIANAYSAIAGSAAALRKPLLVKKMAEPGGTAAKEFTAEEINPLPVSAATLDTIRHGLTSLAGWRDLLVTNVRKYVLRRDNVSRPWRIPWSIGSYGYSVLLAAWRASAATHAGPSVSPRVNE